jgi:hypothetical protein
VLGGENAPQMRVFEILRDAIGTPLPRRIPFAVAAVVARLEEARARITGATPLLTTGIVQIFRHDWSLDSARSVGELNYRVRPLAEGLSDTISALSIRPG